MSVLKCRIGTGKKKAPQSVYECLTQAYAELEALTNSVPGGVAKVVIHPANKSIAIEYASDGFFELSGYTRAEFTKKMNSGEVFPILPKDLPKLVRSIHKQICNTDSPHCEYRVLRKDGSLAWVMVQGRVISAKDGFYTIMCIFTDITALKVAQQKLEIEEERYRIVADISDDYLFEYDIATDTMIYSEKYASDFRVNRVQPDYMQSLRVRDVIPPSDWSAFEEIYDNLRQGQKIFSQTYRFKNPDGELRWYSICFTTMYDDKDEPMKSIGKITNIDAMKRENERLREKSQRDSLTKLTNKMTTRKLIEEHIRQDNDSLHAVIMIDIDDFKKINDTCGHMAGDYVLTEISTKLKSLFRTTDVVGRVGGDEFLVMLRGIQSDSLIEEKAAAICKIFRTIKIGESSITGSVGISTYPTDGQDFDTLVKKADLAVYDAKRSGKNRYSKYNESDMLS